MTWVKHKRGRKQRVVLDDLDRAIIRRSKETGVELARYYGVHKPTISKIRSSKPRRRE